ncbi:RNA polymerase subunit sigma-70 [Pseudoclavibacter sp. RFBB5]|nr:RNA polymerase subunit sigma-70 [Pseudoclavibacter sp. RFBB5]
MERAIPVVSTDIQIIERSRVQPAAFAELYDRHSRLVHRYAARRTNEQIADDVMSETFLVAFEQRVRFDTTRGEVRAWLLGIATTLLKKHRRVEAREWRSFTASDAAALAEHRDFTPDAEARLDAGARMRSLGSAVASLSKGDRDALLLYALGDLDYEGVAAALGIPIGTVRSRLNRARRKLQRATELQESRRANAQAAHGLETRDGRDRTAAPSAR